MNNVGEKYLPLGTVVILKNAKKRLMITGFCAKDASSNSNNFYDYSGCMFPEGFISSNQTALFNHDQIDKVYHMGLVDEEENTFKEKLKQLVAATNLVSVQAPESVLNQSGVKVEESIDSIPPIGPGLPGYVAPQPEIEDIANIPPIGPGLPGYVEPKVEESNIQLEQNINNGIKFDENGVVIADFQFDTDN